MQKGQTVLSYILVHVIALHVLTHRFAAHAEVRKSDTPCDAHIPSAYPGCKCVETESHEQLVVDCTQQNLTSIPANISGLTSLKVTGNNIPIVFDVPYPELEALHLELNQIRFVVDGAFKNLGKLVTLSIADNDIASIRKETFRGLKSVELLVLSGNPLYTILAETFTYETLPALEILKLERCSIISIEQNSFAGLVHLSTLSLAVNRLESLPTLGDDRKLPELRTLDVSKNRIRLIGVAAFVHLSGLTTLHLEDNLLTFIANGSFGGALKDSLTILTLRNNTLSKIGKDGLYYLSKLDTLDLSFNSLERLDSDALPWDVLKKVLIHDNPWDCGDCANSWLVEEETARAWNSESNVTCASPKEQFGRSVYQKGSVTDAFSKCNAPEPCSYGCVLIGVAVVALIVLVISVLCLFVKRRRNEKRTKKANGEKTSITTGYSKMNQEQFTIDDEREEL